MSAAVGARAMQSIQRDLMKTVAFFFHERAWRRMDGGRSARKNATHMCCGLVKAE